MAEPSEASQYIAEYIIALRNRGPFLIYNDYALIEQWIEQCHDVDQLLLVLDDILPPHFAKFADKQRIPGLKKIAKKVSKSLITLNGN